MGQGNIKAAKAAVAMGFVTDTAWGLLMGVALSVGFGCVLLTL